MTTIGTAGKVFQNEPGAWKPFEIKKRSCCADCADQERGFAGKIDHTNLKPDATQEDIQHLCEEARIHQFAAVCVNPCHVRRAARLLKGSGVKVCAVAGFPLGAGTPESKAFEARDAVNAGADEIDMVINIGALKSKDYEAVRRDIRVVRDATQGKVLKVILETALLTKEEIVRAALYAKDAGADFVKTSTGFSSRGASVEDVKIIRESVGPNMKIKAAGGIKDRKFAEELVKAGADRIGASASVAMIVNIQGGGEKHG